MSLIDLIAEDAEDRIAIVGIGCRYPQASNPIALWDLLMNSGNAISSYSGTRFAELDAFYANSQKRPGKVAIHRGGFLPDIDRFDPSFFGIAPREAMYMDPQHRLLLEIAWEALEDAGQTRERYLGSKTGVYVGLWTNEFAQHLYNNATESNFYMMTGGGHAPASGRISFAFGLEGPSVSIDTACSSSLVALHLACSSLLSGQTNMALAGGVNLILGTAYSEQFMSANMLAPDGLCKFGDSAANGFVRSEGAGLVVLKRLKDAINDGDRIYAVVRGGAVNNDGRTNGLMATPSVEGQQQMLRQAWQASGIDPGSLKYIEAHGTGTGIGDPVEIEAIGRSLAEAGVIEPCLIGSIKTNIGHTETASGIAGVIKVALALHHRRVPPSLHFHTPNPKIPWGNLPVQVAVESTDLSNYTEPILAGVNSFGLTGTNAHIVLESVSLPTVDAQEPAGPHIFLATGHTNDALIANLSGALEACSTTSASLYQICRTSALRRTHLDYRASISATSVSDLREKLTATIEGNPIEGASIGRRSQGERRIVFVAPGQGSQWAGMARELYDSEPIFRLEFARCSAALEAEAGWSLIQRILGPNADQALNEIDVVQPALFAVSSSLAALWRSRGVQPDAVVGHSMGEVAAAYIAGALNLEDAVAVISRRSRLMKTIRGMGAMATIELPVDAIKHRLAPFGANISIAASNSPDSTVVAGDSESIDLLLASLESEAIFCRRIKVDVASHSSQVDPILAMLQEQLAGLHPKPTAIPLYSTVFRRYLNGQEMNGNYWAENLRRPVLFSESVIELARSGHNTFIELSPHPILTPAIQASLSTEPIEVIVAPSMRRDKPERATMLNSLGALFNSGYPVAWNALFAGDAPQVDLPSYAFQRDRCWPESEILKKHLHQHDFERKHPLLGSRFSSSQQHDTVEWEIDLDLTRLPWLRDHIVRGSIVLPATAHIEIALEAASSLEPQSRYAIRDLVLEEAITLFEDQPQRFQIALISQGDSFYTFEIRSRAKDSNGNWVLHSRGALELANEASHSQSAAPIEQLKNDGMHTIAESHYAAMSHTGIEYGPAFRLFAEAWTINDSAQNRSLARIKAETYQDAEYQNYVIHPAVLDACLQSLAQVGPLAGKSATDTYLPVGIERFAIHRPLDGHNELYALVTATHIDTSQDFFSLNLSIFTNSGDLLVSLEGLKAQRVHSADSNDVSSLLFNIDWQPSETPAPVLSPAIGQHLLVFANRNGIANALKDLVTGQGAKCTLVYPGDQFAEIEQGDIYEVHPLENEHLDRLFNALSSTPPSAVVHLWSVEGEVHGDPNINMISRALDHTAYHLPLLVRAITSANFDMPPRLWVITNGVMPISDRTISANIVSAPLWGAGIAIAREHPELRPCVIDTVSSPSGEDLYHLVSVLLSGDEKDDRIALRDQKRYVPRLTHFQPATSSEKSADLKPDEEYRVEILNPGILDNLSLRAFKPRAPGPGEVAIRIITSGINFIDVAKTMGIYPGLDPDAPIMLGGECTGRILAVGDGVFQFSVGDEVVAMTENTVTNGLLASHTVLPQELVFRKPANLSDEEASSILIAYLTAYHSLVKLAHIVTGEWVLIHAGAGGVGLAAIKIAQQAGARIIATASSPDKHEFLKSLGVEHVLQSRSTDFARQAMEITDEHGVDIVLNSLSGEFITKSLEILAPYGRFIELGKRDIYQDRRVGLKAFRNNISYHVVDIAAAIVEQRIYVAELLRLVVEKVSTGAWPPLPVTTFHATEVRDAIRFIMQARHIGKVVLTHSRDIQILPIRGNMLFRDDASYIITGGLGGVGSAAARWMAANGAGHIVLVSRREATPETEALIQEVEQAGVRVQHIQADVADHHQVKLLMETIHRSLPPLKGILHAAAAIDDALALDMTRERFATAIAAKVNGTWNLHTESLEDDLDFFVLFSSVAALYPQVGVTSYAAANTFLDSFAEYRRHLGLPATSINWGGWDNTGLAREAGTVRSIDSYGLQGLMNFSQVEGLECLRTAILQNINRVAVFRIQIDEFERYHAKDGVPPIFSVLAQTEREKPDTARDEILDKLFDSPSRAVCLDLIEEYLQQQLSHVLKLAVDRIDRERTLGTMGLDSLMALELIRRINAGLKLALPATVAFNYPSIRQLATHILQKLALDTSNASTAEPVTKAQAPSFASIYADNVSEQDVLNELMMPDGAAYEQ